MTSQAHRPLRDGDAARVRARCRRWPDGAFDDSIDAGKVQKHYVVDAVDALLEGKTPKVAVTVQQFGCGISYE